MAHFLLLVFEHVLDPWPCPGVHHVVPVLVGVGGQLFPPFDDKHAGVANLAVSHVLELEAADTVTLILFTVSESRATKRNNIR